MPNPIDQVFPQTGNGNRGALVDFFKQRMAVTVNSLSELRGNDFSGHTYLRVSTTDNLYKYAALETGADDGSAIIHDNQSNRFVLTETLPGMFDHKVEGVPDNGLGNDGELAFDVIDHKIYLKENGSWVYKSTISAGSTNASNDIATALVKAKVSSELNARRGIILDYKNWVAGILDPDDLSNEEFGAIGTLSGETIDRASIRYVMGPEGKFVSVPANTLAKQFDNRGRLSGVRLARETTNICSKSVDFSTASLTRLTVTTNSVDRFIDGFDTYTFLETTGSGGHYIRLAADQTPAVGKHTFSAIIRPIGGRNIRMSLDTDWTNESPLSSIIFDLENGTTTDVNGNVTEEGVQNLGGGLYRIWMTEDIENSVAGNVSIYSVDDDDVSFVGDPTKGFRLGHIQVVAGQNLGPVVVTTGSAVTHEGDDYDFSLPTDFFTDRAFSLIVIYREAEKTGSTRRILQIGDNASERLGFFLNNGNTFPSMESSMGTSDFLDAATSNEPPEGSRIAQAVTVSRGTGDSDHVYNHYVNGQRTAGSPVTDDFDASQFSNLHIGNYHYQEANQADVVIERIVMLDNEASFADILKQSFHDAVSPAIPNGFLAGGVIRNYGSGWELIDDASHYPLFITNVETFSTHITITRDDADGVYSVIAVADNSMAEAGYTVGVSGGGKTANLVIYDSSGTVVDPTTINQTTLPNANIWFAGMTRLNEY